MPAPSAAFSSPSVFSEAGAVPMMPLIRPKDRELRWFPGVRCSRKLGPAPGRVRENAEPGLRWSRWLLVRAAMSTTVRGAQGDVHLTEPGVECPAVHPRGAVGAETGGKVIIGEYPAARRWRCCATVPPPWWVSQIPHGGYGKHQHHSEIPPCQEAHQRDHCLEPGASSSAPAAGSACTVKQGTMARGFLGWPDRPCSQRTPVRSTGDPQ